MNRRRLLVFLAVVVAGVIVFQLTQRQHQKPAQPPPTLDAPNLNVLNPANIVSIQCVLAGGGPCTVTISGHYGETLDRSIFKLSPENPRPPVKRVPGPFTIDSVIVDRGRQVNRQELKITIPAGQSRELR
ncbi:MAG TPA: hypothetical protein VH120_21490, partial [Gemmataceae bacterium]|nr:hypothetical protein [Gemmataceae bacterium]